MPFILTKAMSILITWVARYWVVITSIMLIAVTSVSLRPLELSLPPNSDKTLHFITYAILAIPIGLRRPKQLLMVICGLAAWSGIIELIQPHVGRYGEWADLVANVLGLILGLVLARCIVFLSKPVVR